MIFNWKLLFGILKIILKMKKCNFYLIFQIFYKFKYECFANLHQFIIQIVGIDSMASITSKLA